MQESIRRPPQRPTPKTRQDAGRDLGTRRLHRHYVSDIERGAHNPCLETIAKLAWALRVSPTELFRDFTVTELDSIFGD
jgi:transcriptional regulator with XRE-family HTH domain